MPCLFSGLDSWADVQVAEQKGPIYKLDIQSDCAWIGELYYEALGADTNEVFVQAQRDCGGNYPCFDTVQQGWDWAMDGADIYIGQGEYGEPLRINEYKQLNLSGGWDSSFIDHAGESRVASMEIKRGTVKVKGLHLGQ